MVLPSPATFGARGSIKMDGQEVRELVALGKDHYQRGEYAAAAGIFEQVIARGAAYADVHHLLGLIYHQMGEFESALHGSNVRVPKDLQPDLPRLLWLYQMGIILFWIFDSSPKQVRTRTLIDGTLDLIVRLIRLSSLPLMGPLRRRLLHTLRAATI